MRYASLEAFVEQLIGMVFKCALPEDCSISVMFVKIGEVVAIKMSVDASLLLASITDVVIIPSPLLNAALEGPDMKMFTISWNAHNP